VDSHVYYVFVFALKLSVILGGYGTKATGGGEAMKFDGTYNVIVFLSVGSKLSAPLLRQPTVQFSTS
jgi:hypothetical protein